MKVINVLGFPYKFIKDGKEFFIPFDRRVYEIPDSCINDNFNGVFLIVERPKEVPISSIIEIDLSGKNVNEQIKEENKKPLSGVKLKPKKRQQLKRTRNTRPDLKKSEEVLEVKE